MKRGTKARDRERRWERRRSFGRSTSATKGGALARELVSENVIGLGAARPTGASIVRVWQPKLTLRDQFGQFGFLNI